MSEKSGVWGKLVSQEMSVWKMLVTMWNVFMSEKIWCLEKKVSGKNGCLKDLAI